MEGIRFEMDINFCKVFAQIDKNFAQNESSSFIGQEYTPSSDTRVATKKSSTSQFYSQNLEEIDSFSVFSPLVKDLNLSKLPPEMGTLFQNIKSSLLKNLKIDREVQFYQREVLLKHIREQTRFVRNIVHSMMTELCGITKKKDNLKEIGFILALMLDLFWKNTVSKLDRYVGYFDQHIGDALKYLKQKYSEFQVNHEKRIGELKAEIKRLKEENVNQVKQVEESLEKSRRDKLNIQELYQSNNRFIQQLNQKEYGQKVVKELSTAIKNLTSFIEDAEEHKEEQLGQLEQMNEMIVTYEENYRRKEAACQTDLSSTQYTTLGLPDISNYYFVKHLHPLAGRVKKQGKEGRMTMHQLVKLFQQIIEQKRLKNPEDQKAGRPPTSLRDYALIHFYKRNQLNTQMLGKVAMQQLINMIRYLLRKGHPFGELLSKLLWVDIEKPFSECYIQLFIDLHQKYHYYFSKGKGKGNLDQGSDEFGIVRLYDLLGYLKHDYKNQNEQHFASSVLDYVTAQNFKKDFTVNNQRWVQLMASKYIVSEEEIKQRMTTTNQMHRYDYILIHQLNFALFSLAIQLEDFKISLEDKLQSFQFKSYSLITIADFEEFLLRIEDLPVFIPKSHKHVFSLFFSSFQGMQDVVTLQFPPRKCDSPVSIDSRKQRYGSPVSSFTVTPSAKKVRKLSDLDHIERKDSICKEIRHQIADPLEINIIEITGESDSKSSHSEDIPLFIDVQLFIETLKREEIHLNSHSVQISNLGIYLGFIRAIEDCDHYMTAKVKNYLTRVNQLKDLKNDFTYFRNALKHFVPYIDIAKVSHIFDLWSKQCDCENVNILTQIYLETIKNEDMKAGHTLLLTPQKLSRAPTPRKQSPSNIDFRKRTSYMASNSGGQFKGNDVLRRISDMK